MSDDAKVLTPAEAECLPEHGDEDGGMPGVVLVDRDDLLATTRALETAQKAETKAAADAMRDWDSLRQEFEANVATLRERADRLERERDAARAEVRALFEDVKLVRQHAADLAQRRELAESERDEARGEARAHRAALDDATASCHGLGCGRCEDCVSMQRARAEKAERELAEISHQTVDGSVVAKMSRKSLERFAVRLHQERNTAERERDACAAELADRYDAKQAIANAEAERDAALKKARDWPCLDCQPESPEKAGLKTLVAELVAALEGLFVEYDYLCSEGSKYALRLGRVPDHACAECVPGGPIVEPGFKCREHAARVALAKAKGTAS